MTLRGHDLLKEKSLWDIYKQSFLKLPPSYFNIISTAAVFILLICDCAYFPEHHLARVATARSLAELGLGFGTTILGFLIAGFTIFATLSKPELFLRMHETPHKQSGLSYFKVNFFAFVEVFAVYLAFLILCLVTKLFCGSGGLVSSLIVYSNEHPFFGYSLDRPWLGNGYFTLISVFSFYSLVALKSFVYNTYHTVITAVLWAFNSPDQNLQ